MELTDDEKALILKNRAAAAQEQARLEFRRKAITTAAEWEAWSEENGLDLTFSAFVNNFGYQNTDGKVMYEAVKRIRAAV